MLNVNDKYFSNENIVDYYKDVIENVGLWNSEKTIISKYSNLNSKILDIGCGVGRLSFGLLKEGYKNIYGIDISHKMIIQANNMNKLYNSNIIFSCQDASDMNFNNNYFDVTIFSFNGLCTIPFKEKRFKVLKEINRVLKNDGIFIFMADDQRMNIKYKEHWETELNKWATQSQDKRLYDFGDIIFKDQGEEAFFHFFGKDELIELLNKSGFILLNSISMNSFKENENIKSFCPKGRFWITKKKH
jgi:ubiquinone/menaquinone biosynthesis C-methylase UbiE